MIIKQNCFYLLYIFYFSITSYLELIVQILTRSAAGVIRHLPGSNPVPQTYSQFPVLQQQFAPLKSHTY